MHDRLDLGHDDTRTVIDLPLEVKADGAPGTFEGYGAIFGNTDRDGDVVARGAFAESLKARTPALLWQHNAKEPIGRFDVVREDERGLYVKGRLSMTGRGAEAYDLLKLGALNGLSIGFVTKEAMRNRATGTRTIKRADLMEVSLVTFPANELARVQTVKGDRLGHLADDIETPRAFERMLRDAGFSRSRAKAITARGFRGTGFGNLDAHEIGVLMEKLERKKRVLKGVESKRSGFSSLFRRGVPGVQIPELLSLVAGAYRSLRGTSMPIFLLPGETRKFSLPLRSGVRPKTPVIIRTPDSVHEFECKIQYIRWTNRGPVRATLPLTNRKFGGDIETGGLDAVEKWLQTEKQKLETEDRLDQFDRIVARVETIINEGLAPVGTIKNKRVIQNTPLSNSVRISISDTEKPEPVIVAKPFIIKTE